MRPLALVEAAVKKPVFGCQMCGQCVLHSTGMTCPMNCPKTLRNGPCGGVRPDGNCEVDPEMRCVWLKPSGRARAEDSRGLARESTTSVSPSTTDSGTPRRGRTTSTKRDRLPHPKGLACRGLRQQVDFGRFVLTARAPDRRHAGGLEAVHRPLRPVRGMGRCRECDRQHRGACACIAPLAVAIALQQLDMEPVMQLVCRDRNRLALGGRDRGSGVARHREHLLSLTGDDVTAGDEPEARRVFDLDSNPAARHPRARCAIGHYLSGRKIEPAPRLFLGAVENPSLRRRSITAWSAR